MSTKDLAKRPVGRPTKFNENLADALLADIATSREPISRIVIKHNIAEISFYSWLHVHEDFQFAYAKALESRALIEFEGAEQDLAELERFVCKNPDIDAREKHVRIQLARLKLEHKRWRLARMNRNVFGEKIDVAANLALTAVDSRDRAWQMIQQAKNASYSVIDSENSKKEKS